MKIAIFGSHNVGKTSLAEELLENLPGYSLELEPYYQLESSGYEFSEIPNADDFLEQFEFSAKLISQSDDTNVMFDRSVIDLLGYLHILDPDRNIQFLLENTLNLINKYDLLIFVPIENPDIIPSHQIHKTRLRNQVNDLLYDWIQDFGIEVIEVTGSLSNRRDQVLARIRL